MRLLMCEVILVALQCTKVKLIFIFYCISLLCDTLWSMHSGLAIMEIGSFIQHTWRFALITSAINEGRVWIVAPLPHGRCEVTRLAQISFDTVANFTLQTYKHRSFLKLEHKESRGQQTCPHAVQSAFCFTSPPLTGEESVWVSVDLQNKCWHFKKRTIQLNHQELYSVKEVQRKQTAINPDIWFQSPHA